MSLYPQPIIHNGIINTTFNASDFNSFSTLKSTNITGSLAVAGLTTLNGGLVVNGTTTSSNLITAQGGIKTGTGTSGINSIYVGQGTSSTPANNNIAIVSTLPINTVGSGSIGQYNIAVGSNCLNSNTTGNSNVAIGVNAHNYIIAQDRGILL
jgi:hypothetical protein